MPGEPIWSRQLADLFSQTSCSRETCFVTSSFIDTDGHTAAPNNYIFLTSFPYVVNLQMANVKVVHKFVKHMIRFLLTLSFDLDSRSLTSARSTLVKDLSGR